MRYRTAAPENRLRVARAELRVGQYDVSGAIGISRDRYWRIENSYAIPTERERAALSAFFGVAEGDLFPERRSAVAS
jgi:transcriptional regulator with XRE-family HTH domain